jgi:hypothetical protein
VLGALSMFDRTREQPAGVFGMEWVVWRAELSGESTHLSSFTSVLVIHAHEALLIRKFFVKQSILTHWTFLTTYEGVIGTLLDDSQVTF